MALMGMTLLILAVSLIFGHDRLNWVLETFPVLIGLPILVYTYKKSRLTTFIGPEATAVDLSLEPAFPIAGQVEAEVTAPWREAEVPSSQQTVPASITFIGTAIPQAVYLETNEDGLFTGEVVPDRYTMAVVSVWATHNMLVS